MSFPIIRREIEEMLPKWALQTRNARAIVRKGLDALPASSSTTTPGGVGTFAGLSYEATEADEFTLFEGDFANKDVPYSSVEYDTFSGLIVTDPDDPESEIGPVWDGLTFTCPYTGVYRIGASARIHLPNHAFVTSMNLYLKHQLGDLPRYELDFQHHNYAAGIAEYVELNGMVDLYFRQAEQIRVRVGSTNAQYDEGDIYGFGRRMHVQYLGDVPEGTPVADPDYL